MNIVIIVQGRMGSNRLPGKSLMPICGKPLVERVLTQVSACSNISETWFATTELDSDDPLATFVSQLGYPVYRGSSEDVLSRYLGAASNALADAIVRITADCPLHSPDTIEEVVEEFKTGNWDYVCNTSPYSRPDGQDVEIFTFDSLMKASKEATSKIDREHVTPWIKRNNKLRKLDFIHDFGYNGVAKWSVDTQEDFSYVEHIWKNLIELDSKLPALFSDIVRAESYVKRRADIVINEGLYFSYYNESSADAAPKLKLENSHDLFEKSRKYIPGEAQTYSKSWRHHIFGVTPMFLQKGVGARVYDVDGNEYIDLIQGLLPNILGYADPTVDEAVKDQISRGISFSLPHPLEIELAEKLCTIIPSAEMVRFGKNGSDATAGAVSVARAYTGKERVAVCGYHGWQDWFIGSTSRSEGVPNAVRNLVSTFVYNDLDSLERILAEHRGEFAAIIMEPVNFVSPLDGFLEGVAMLARTHDALLIFDEICSGFHLGLGGAQKIYGVTPDLSCFGKAMGNGWPISCIVGKRDVMRKFEDAFFSFTFGGDLASIVAATKVIQLLEEGSPYLRMTAAGTQIFNGSITLAKAAGLANRFSVSGHPHWASFAFFDENGNPDPYLRAVWIQEVTRRGVLILTTFNVCAALTEGDVHRVLSAFASAFKYIASLISAGKSLSSHLDGPLPVPAFKVRGQ